MFAVNEYEEIIKRERQLGEKHIIVLLFVRPSLPGAMDVIQEFNYIHHNSERYCSVYAIGYSDDFDKMNSKHYKKAGQVDSVQWYFSDKKFVEFKNNLEDRLKWKYSGEIEILVLQSNPEGRNILNFQNFVSIDVNHGIREGYIASFHRFMESLVRASRSEVTSREAINEVKKSRLGIKSIVNDLVSDCKKVPTPVKKIIKDNLFLKASSSY